jgi:AcrR family transcriptional regulator
MSDSLLAPISRGRGRPREFDIAQALDGAIRVFRERGYHATSVVDLQAATALASGSIYKAFKDKRAVFLAAFDRYVSQRDALRRSALQNCVTGRDKLRDVLNLYAESSSGAEGQRGCLVVGSIVELATLDEDISGRVKDALARHQALLGELIREGQTDGSIALDIDADAAARLMLCLLQGMRVIGKTGRTRDEMTAVVDLALKTVA